MIDESETIGKKLKEYCGSLIKKLDKFKTEQVRSSQKIIEQVRFEWNVNRKHNDLDIEGNKVTIARYTSSDYPGVVSKCLLSR